jgi:hypothetical protein
MMDQITGYFVKGGHAALGLGWYGKAGIIILGLFWVAMIYNCMQRKFKTNHDKIAWIIVLVFLKFLGAFIYLFWMFFALRKKK